jgi:hypothetical protein
MRHLRMMPNIKNSYNLISLITINFLIILCSTTVFCSIHNLVRNNQLEDEFSNCLSLSCNLPNDPNCNLKWIYDQNNPDYLSFKLTLTKPSNNAWFAIGFNPNQKHLMIGTNLIVIKFGSKFEIYNG